MKAIEIFKLFGSVFIDNEKANKALDQTDMKGKFLASNIGKIGESATKMALVVGAAAIGVGASMFAVAEKTGEYAGQINDASKVTSLTTDNLQQLKYAAEQSGVSFESLTGAATKFNKTFAEASQGSKKATDSFKELGIALTDNGEMKSSNDLFNETITKLAQMGDTGKATALGIDIFGKGFANLKPLLAEGAGGIEELKLKAQELGLVMSQESIVAGDNFADTVDTLKQAFGSLGREVGTVMIPYMQKFADWIIKNMPEIKQFTKEAFESFGKAIDFVVKNLGILIPIITTTLVAIAGFNIIKTVLALMDLWKVSTIALAFANGTLNISMMPIILTVAAISGAIALLILNIDKVMKAWGNFVDSVYNTGKGLFGGFNTNLDSPSMGRYTTSSITTNQVSSAGVTNTYGNVNVTIPAKDLKEMKDMSDFFNGVNRYRGAYGG